MPLSAPHKFAIRPAISTVGPSLLKLMFCLALLSGSSGGVPARNLGKPAQQDAPRQSGRDPAALALRDKILKAYRDLHAIHEKVTQRQWRTSSKDDVLTIQIELRYRKPNRLYLAIDYPYIEKPGHWQLIYACDGKTLTVYNGARDEYQTAKSPARLDRLVLPQALRGPEFVTLLRETNPFEDLEKSAVVRYGELFEESAQGSWHTLKLDLQQDGAKRTLRYQAGVRDNLIHGMALSIVPDPDSGNPFSEPELASNLRAAYTLVEANPRFTDADFRFTPPAGARQIKADSSKPAGGQAEESRTRRERP